MNKRFFSGQVALVTGASAGIGKATAIAFAREGAAVALSDVSVEAGEKLAAEIVKTYDVPAFFIPCDVSKHEHVKQLVQKTVVQLGRLDYAFNNAGIEGAQGSVVDCTEENWDRTINTDLKGVWLCMKYELEQMLKQKSGSIVNCSSIAGLVGFPGIPAYTASKHGVLGLTKTAALEMAKTGIRVNAVCPGVIDTPMIERFTGGNAAAVAQLANSEPVGRVGKPEEVAETVIWLCSSKASFVTGQCLAVDGGWVAQ